MSPKLRYPQKTTQPCSSENEHRQLHRRENLKSQPLFYFVLVSYKQCRQLARLRSMKMFDKFATKWFSYISANCNEET